MLPLLTSTRHIHDQRPPEFPWALNEDSAQAQGLVAFWPLGYESSVERDARSLYDMTVNGPSLATSDVVKASRLFNDASSQYLQYAGAVVGAGVPFTIGCWGRSDDATVTQTLVSISTTSAAENRERACLEMGGAVAGDPVQYATANATSVATAATTTGYTVGQWHHACFVHVTNTNKAVFIDGGSRGTDTTNRSFSAPNVTSIGCRQGTTRSTFMSGNVAHVCIWNRPLSNAEVAGLYDPETRWELYYPIGRKTWSFKPAGGATSFPFFFNRYVASRGKA